MMAAALALARCGPSQRTRRQCLLAASRRARSASASASTSGSSAAPAFPRHALAVPRRGARARHAAPRAFASSAASAVDAADADLRLPSPGDVHLWLFDPDDADDAAILSRYETEVLSADERESVSRQSSTAMTDGARAQVVRSRALMRCVLARYCGKNVPPSGLRFELGERGKPSLAGYVERDDDERNVAPPPPLRFSLSHTNKLLALAVTSAPNAVDAANAMTNVNRVASVCRPFDARHEIGVDCEDEDRRTSGSADRLARRWLSRDEHAHLASFQDDNTRASRFMRLWTLKEAYVKALGTGIAAHPFARFDVSMTPSTDESEPVERVELRERSACPGSSLDKNEDDDEDDERDAHSRDAETKLRNDWAASARGWRFTLIRVKRGEGLICAVCAWAGLPGSDGDALTARRSAGSVSVRWTVPLLGDLEPEAKPPPEMVAASAR